MRPIREDYESVTEYDKAVDQFMIKQLRQVLKDEDTREFFRSLRRQP